MTPQNPIVSTANLASAAGLWHFNRLAQQSKNPNKLLSAIKKYPKITCATAALLAIRGSYGLYNWWMNGDGKKRTKAFKFKGVLNSPEQKYTVNTSIPHYKNRIVYKIPLEQKKAREFDVKLPLTDEEQLEEYLKYSLKDHLEGALRYHHDFKNVDTKKTFPEILATEYFTRFNKLRYYKQEVSDLVKQEQLKHSEQLIKHYQELENGLKSLKNDPAVSLFGGINYAMTFDEMQQVLQKQFKEFKEQGLIVTAKEFDKIKDRYYTKYISNNDRKDLSRIWTAKYLRDRISKNENLRGKYDTPGFIIVADNPDMLSVRIWGDRLFPVAGFLENGAIYFQHIQGYNSGCNATVKKDIGQESSVGYIDLCDITKECKNNKCYNYRQNENIIKSQDSGVYYIIDTEYKSCEPLQGWKDSYYSLWYGFQKFCYLNKVDLYRYTDRYNTPISLEDLDNYNESYPKDKFSLTCEIKL